MERQELKQKMLDKIGNFGDGLLEFETKDVEVLIRWIEDLEKKAHQPDKEQGEGEEKEYMKDLIDELISIHEHPGDSNKEWKQAIIEIAKEKGYGYSTFKKLINSRKPTPQRDNN